MFDQFSSFSGIYSVSRAKCRYASLRPFTLPFVYEPYRACTLYVESPTSLSYIPSLLSFEDSLTESKLKTSVLPVHLQDNKGDLTYQYTMAVEAVLWMEGPTRFANSRQRDFRKVKMTNYNIHIKQPFLEESY